MFNYKSGVAIAKLGDKTIYLNKDNFEPEKDLSKEFKEKYKNLSLSEIRKLYKSLREDKEPKSKKLLKAFEDAKEEKKLKDKENSFSQLKCKTGKIQVLPRKDIVEKLYISGVSGSGKSTYTGKYLEEYVKLYPDDPVFIFSSVPEDKPLDKIDPVRIDIDEDLIEDPFNIQDFRDSITIFDDTDTIKNKILRTAVNNIKAEMIEIGRHYNARCIITSHIISNYRDTRQILNEATSVTFFPKSGGVFHIKNFLKTYCGLDKKQIQQVLDLPSRWVTIYRTYPSYIIYEKGLSTLSDFGK